VESSQTILAGGAVIIAVGFVSATVNNRPKTPVFAGGVGIVLFASLIDMIGGQASKLATAFMGLAVVAVLLVELPSVATAIGKAQGGQTQSQNVPQGAVVHHI